MKNRRQNDHCQANVVQALLSSAISPHVITPVINIRLAAMSATVATLKKQPRAGPESLGLQEAEQVVIDEVRMCRAQTMRRPRNEFQLCTLDEFHGENRCVIRRHNLVLLAVDKEGRNIDVLEVLRKVIF